MGTRAYIVSIVACVAASAALLALGAVLDAFVLEVAGVLCVIAALLIRLSGGSARSLGNWALLMLAVIAVGFLAGLLFG